MLVIDRTVSAEPAPMTGISNLVAPTVTMTKVSHNVNDDRTTLPPLGFISIDVILHRPPGDPFNAQTWPFPLIREKASNSSESLVVSVSYDETFIDRFVDAGKRLAERGAIGIITSCGFLALAQPELAARLPIPIATSALVQVPSILALLPSNRTIGILTFDGDLLGDGHLKALNIPRLRCHIRGVPSGGVLQRHIRRGDEYVHEDISNELVQTSLQMMKDHPDIAAFCLECTQMPPFAGAIQEAIKMPVYDVHSMGCWFYSGLASQRPERWGVIPPDRKATRT